MSRRTRTLRGGVLFEVLLSIALFVGAAAFAFSATRNVFSGLDRTYREQQAADLARSKLAELEAGLIGLGDLRGEPIRSVGSIESYVDDEWRDGAAAPRWIVEADTQRTEHTGLTLVEITVSETTDSDQAVAYTLRTLMRLRDTRDEEYEEDDLLDDLPEPADDEGFEWGEFEWEGFDW